MPSATITQRELKNKQTGVDVSVPTHKSLPGLLSANIVYQVVVVSRLQCFKSPKHKETDVVQFVLSKEFIEFETLRKQLAVKFPGTVFPTLPSTVLSFSDSNVKARQSALDSLVKFIACTPKLVSSSTTLEFLGVNALTASNFRPDEASASPSKEVTTATDIFEDQRQGQESSQSLFGTEDDDNDDGGLFTSVPTAAAAAASSAAAAASAASKTSYSEAAALFEETDSGQTKLFTGVELEGEVHEDDQEFYVPGAWDSQKTHLEIEDNSQLLTIEDDLDKLLLHKPEQTRSRSESSGSRSSTENMSKQQQKPPPPVKPKPGLKPKPKLAPKPLAPKPAESAEKTADMDDLFSLETDQTEKMDATDILKYIQQNEASEEDVDLFS